MKRKNLFPVLIILLLVVLFGSYYLFSDNSRYETIDLSPTLSEGELSGGDICKDKSVEAGVCVGTKYCECSSSATGNFIVPPEANGECPKYGGGIACSLEIVPDENAPDGIPFSCHIVRRYASQNLDYCDSGCYELAVDVEFREPQPGCCEVRMIRDCTHNPDEIA